MFTNVQANASLTYQAGHRGQLIVTRPTGELVDFGAEHNDFRVHAIGGEFTQFHAWLRCVAPGPGRLAARPATTAPTRTSGASTCAPRTAPPALTLTGGSLLEDPVVRGVRGLRFDAVDEGGGVRSLHVAANGTSVTDVRNCALAAGYATALRPCPGQTGESAAVPTAHSAFVTGPNTVTACADDLALDGAPNRACQEHTAWVDNACPGSAVAGGTALSAGFGADGGASVTVRSDRRAMVRGRLGGVGAGRRSARSPAPIRRGADRRRGHRHHRRRRRSRSSFSPGPSRDVFVHYADGDRVVARHGLVRRSIVRPTLVAKPNHGVRRGDRLHFTGRLPGPAAPSAWSRCRRGSASVAGRSSAPTGRIATARSPPATSCAPPVARGATASAPSSSSRRAIRTRPALADRAGQGETEALEPPQARHCTAATREPSPRASP